jgi:hypothetical protein
VVVVVTGSDPPPHPARAMTAATARLHAALRLEREVVLVYRD